MDQTSIFPLLKLEQQYIVLHYYIINWKELFYTEDFIRRILVKCFIQKLGLIN